MSLIAADAALPPAADTSLRGRLALEQIVRRSLDMVYSSALRRVGDRHLAEDVAQAVFIILAKKLPSIRDENAIGPWLMKTTRYAAANALRIESRRQKHEKKAASMNSAAGACSGNPTDVLLWQEVAQHLDDAVLKLPALDRQAVLLRYFENKRLAEIADAMNVTPEAAQRRLSRAIEKLRTKLSRNTAILPAVDAAAFATLLASHAVQSAPAGLMQSTLAGAAAPAAASGAGIAIAKGAIKMMAWTKVKIAAVLVGVTVIGGAGGVATLQHVMAAAPAAKPQASTKKKLGNDVANMQTARPVVVESFPRAGATDVDPTTTEIKVTYSKDMQDGSWSWSTWGQENFPKTTGKPHYLDDKRTCVLPVKLEPEKFYAIWLNSDNFGNFTDANGIKAVPYLLVFETKK